MEVYNYETLPLIVISIVIAFVYEYIKNLRNDNTREKNDIKAQDFILELALDLQKKVNTLEQSINDKTQNIQILEQNLLVVMNEKDELVKKLFSTNELNEKLSKENKELKTLLTTVNDKIDLLRKEIEEIKKTKGNEDEQ